MAFLISWFRAANSVFPLSVHASGRYFVGADGQPFFMHGDTPWMMPNQCSDAQVVQYFDSARAYGVNAILIEAPGFLFTSQTPATNNVDGNAPFTTISPHFDWVLASSYWTRVDYIVNQAKARGIFVWINPAYLGINGTAGSGSGIEGCMAEVTNASGATLQAYGAALANRYTQKNVGWCFGGDYAGTVTERDKQWNIATGIRSVRTTDLMMAHPARGEDSYGQWGAGGQNYTGLNVLTTYPAKAGSDAYSLAATAYGRAGPLPVMMVEAGYYGEQTDLEARRALWQSALSGCCGVLMGSSLWSFGCGVGSFPSGGAASALSTWLGSAAYVQTKLMWQLFGALRPYRLTPKTDASLVSSSLGSGTSRVVPALSSNSAYALIYSPGVNVTIVMTNFSQGTVRIRLMNPTTGAFTTVGSFANTGSQTITVASESIVVCD